jgi:uncharacterized protein
MNQEANVCIVQELYAAFGRGDIAAVLAGLDPAITWVNPGPADFPYFGTHRGPEAVTRNIFAFLGEHLDIHQLTPTDLLAKDDRVVVLLHMEATARKTGRRIVQEVVHAWTLNQGRTVHFHDYQDNAQIIAALSPR